MIMRRSFLALGVLSLALPASAAALPKVKVERQPLAAQARRVADALALLGEPLSDADRTALRDAADVNAVQGVLDKRCLVGVHITPGKQLETRTGPARLQLAEQGWRVFLVKVHNEAALANVELTAS